MHASTHIYIDTDVCKTLERNANFDVIKRSEWLQFRKVICCCPVHVYMNHMRRKLRSMLRNVTNDTSN
jgi:hypothetical protein